MELHPAVTVEALPDGRIRAYGAHVGRDVVLDAESWALRAERPGIARRLERLGLHATVALLDLVACRHRATLWLPDEQSLWSPVPSAHGAGGHAYRAVPLPAPHAALWQALNDRRTLAAAASVAGLSGAEALSIAAQWTARDLQALQLRPTPPSPRDPGLVRLVGPPRQAHARTADQHDPSGGTTLGHYHLDAIVDGHTHFDDRETTVAHALALPHPGLAGVAYGAALRRALDHEGPVVEVGCGTGELAAAWLGDGDVPYLRIDLSPELLRTQAEAAPASSGLLGDATRLPLRDASVPFLLSNEVLADLRSVPVASLDAEAQAAAVQYGVEPEGWANVGAWAFVAEVARTLAPGGRAVLTEFGTVDGPAEEAEQLDHPEVSIQFGVLAAVARRLGLRAELVRLDALLGVDLHTPQLSRTSWMALRALARHRGVHLPARAWTMASLSLPWTVEGLHWTTLADEGPGPLITRFYALLLEAPGP